MTFNDIETAIGQHLADMGNTPIAWPNKAFTPDGIYIEFRISPNTIEDRTISGGREYEFGLALITVISPADEFTTESNALAEQIKNRFPKALRLAAGNGDVVINAPTSRAAGFPDGAYWRQPMRVSWITDEN